MMTDTPAQLEADALSRAECQPGEHPLVTRLVVLRVALNYRFGAHEFQPYDHELAQIEGALVRALKK